MALRAGQGRAGQGLAGDEDCAIVFANNTCALIHSARVTSVIFTCCDVREEESNRNSGLILVGPKPFKMLVGAATLSDHHCVLKTLITSTFPFILF